MCMCMWVGRCVCVGVYVHVRVGGMDTAPLGRLLSFAYYVASTVLPTAGPSPVCVVMFGLFLTYCTSHCLIDS